jgi:hypothetical protein
MSNDINTSIGINADASQAINEMRKLQSATNELQNTANNTTIKPKVESAQAAIARDIQATQEAIRNEMRTGVPAESVNSISKAYKDVASNADIANAASTQANVNVGKTANFASANMLNFARTSREAGDSVAMAYAKMMNMPYRIIGNKEDIAAASGYRSAVNSLSESYKKFSSGAASGLDGLRSISLNVLSDIQLIVRTAETMYTVGNKIYEYFSASDDALASVAHRTVEVEKGFIKMGLSAKTPIDAIDELKKKIDELNQQLLDSPAAAYRDQTTEAIQYQNEEADKQEENLKKEIQATQSLKKEYENMRDAAEKRAADRTGLELLDDETKIRKQAEYDVADLRDKMALAQSQREKHNIQIEIDNRTNLMNKQLNELADKNKEEADRKQKEQEDKDKQEAERKQGILDDSRQAEINSMEGINKIDQQYLFDLDKINRDLAKAKDQEERDAIVAKGRARLAQQKRETDEYWADYGKKQEEIAQKQKDKARDAAEYQKSLMEEMIGYQKQIVAGFSGLGQSVFPKEAMNYLRQIAGASNKFP